MNSTFDESYAGRCVRFGCHARAFMLKNQDKDEIERAVNEQVQLLNGNWALYNMINENMINGDMDPFFIREHSTIYAWRESYFNQNFPNGSWFTVDFINDSFPFDPEDDYLRFITIPYQITRYFDRVMALASVKVSPELVWLNEQTYFENNELLSSEAEAKYKWGAFINDLADDSNDDIEKLSLCEEVGVDFGEVSHMIAEVYQTGPKKLEEIALKTILLSSYPRELLTLSHAPAVIRRKVVHGMYSPNDDAPDNISCEGKELFERMKRLFSETLV